MRSTITYMSNRIPLSIPHLSGTEINYVSDAVNSGWIVPLGPNVDAFEKGLKTFLGDREDIHVTALSSGTAALHLGLVILGVKPGDEVICQSMTFSASANPIAYLGATPVFVDSEKDTWNMCPQALRNAIEARIANGKKPKAIIPVHLYGMPAKMDEIMAVANEFEIPVLEDAAEALGSTYNGTQSGTIGEMACLSFNGNKIITTSGGGALVTKTKEDADKSKFLATQARDNAPHYQHTHIGYNYRMSNVCAGIGRGQLEALEERVASRRNNFEYYRQHLSNIEGISFQEEQPGMFSNRWLTSILIDPAKTNGITREDIRLALQEQNIETRPLWKPMHLQPVFADAPYYGSGVSDQLFDIGLCLPSGSNLTTEELERVVSEIKKALGNGL